MEACQFAQEFCSKNKRKSSNPDPFANVASVEAIKNISKLKEYRVYPIGMLNHLRKDRNISIDACWLWVLLYQLAFFDQKWEIQISREEMADQLGRDKRSISRMVKLLVDNNYIVAKSRSGEVPIYSIRFPNCVIEHIQLTEKNRKQPEHKLARHKSNVDKIDKDIEAIRCKGVDLKCNTHMQTSLGRGSKSVKNTNNNIKLNNNNNGEGSVMKVVAATPVVVCDNECEENASKHEKLDNEIESAQSQIYALDKKITMANEQFKTNSLPGTFKGFINDRINNSQSRIKVLEREIKTINQQLSSLKNPQEIRSQLAKYRSLDLQKLQLEAGIERELKQRQEQRQKEVVHERLEDDVGSVQTMPGERQLSEFQMQRLVKQLKACGITPPKLNRLVNEIVYEIRFGSLQQCQTDNAMMSVDHGINVALKLVRERRWQSPKGLQKKILTQVKESMHGATQ